MGIKEAIRSGSVYDLKYWQLVIVSFLTMKAIIFCIGFIIFEGMFYLQHDGSPHPLNGGGAGILGGLGLFWMPFGGFMGWGFGVYPNLEKDQKKYRYRRHALFVRNMVACVAPTLRTVSLP